MLSVRRAGHVGNPATVREEGRDKSGQQEDCDLSGPSKLTVSCSGRAALRREQCDVPPESRDIGARIVP
jgi:hypothetical protein